MNLKKIWNNRIFRTFLQVSLGTFSSYLMETKLNVNNRELLIIIIIAITTGGAKAMPLFDEGDDNNVKRD